MDKTGIPELDFYLKSPILDESGTFVEKRQADSAINALAQYYLAIDSLAKAKYDEAIGWEEVARYVLQEWWDGKEPPREELMPDDYAEMLYREKNILAK